MKRIKECISNLEKIMIFTAVTGSLSWIVALVALIFSVKVAIISFIITSILIAFHVFFAAVWSIYLKILRKKVVKKTCEICDYIKRKENVVGEFEVKLFSKYLLSVTFYTPNLDVINDNKLRSLIKDNVPNEFFLIYKEVLQD